jgi:CheY-like chemotaxis protein
MNKILIVDDVPGWVRFHKTNLEYLNIDNLQIDEAYSANEALSKIEASIDEPYDVIFTDMQMESNFLPKLAGEWLIEQIKTYDKYYKDTKIVIISASPNIERIAKKYEVLYIPKTIIRNSGAEIYRKFISE